MPQARLVQPPWLAFWLLGVFTLDQQTEAIRGDLLEEFSPLVSKMGIGPARRWYRRQTMKTIGDLIDDGLRSAPWLIAGSGLAALLLGCCCSWLTEKTALAVLSRYQVYPHVNAHVFWLAYAMVQRVMIPMFMGGVVAITAKGKEAVAAAVLSAFISASSIAGLMQMATYLPMYFPSWYSSPYSFTNFLAPQLVTIFASPIMIAMGVGVARKIRFVVAS